MSSNYWLHLNITFIINNLMFITKQQFGFFFVFKFTIYFCIYTIYFITNKNYFFVCSACSKQLILSECSAFGTSAFYRVY